LHLCGYITNLEFSDDDNSFIELIYDVLVKNSIIFSSDIVGINFFEVAQ